MDNTEVKTKNIYQRLAEVRKVADFVQKQDLTSEETKKEGKKGLGYKAVSSALVLLKVNQAINDNGLFLTTEIVNKTIVLDEFTNQYGKPSRQYKAEIETLMTWVNIDNPEDKISFKWGCSAVNPAPSQAVGAALTYAEKYFIQKQFNIPSDDLDPDVIDNNKIDKHENSETKNKVTNIQEKKKVFELTNDQKTSIKDKLKACKTLEELDKVKSDTENYIFNKGGIIPAFIDIDYRSLKKVLEEDLIGVNNG